MNRIMPDLSHEFHISVDQLQWAAAFHVKSGHPHVHYMFWNKDKRVESPFIHPSLNNRCRELLSGEMFRLEREQAVIDKTISRDLLIESTKKLLRMN